jgi:glycine/sarcosine/betaine reductase complex component C subunit beta
VSPAGERRVGVLGASLVLEHVPDLVRYGSKPMRESERLPELLASLRTFRDAIGYPPNLVAIGSSSPTDLWDLPRPWWDKASTRGGDPVDEGRLRRRTGEIVDQRRFYELLAQQDLFDLVRLDDKPDTEAGELALYEGEGVVGAIAPGHEADESLSAPVLLENLACKASAVHATRHLLDGARVDPATIDFVITGGEEAIGDRYQRGGGNLAKAVAEQCGLANAGGMDVKAFCAGPIHALVTASALVEAGIHERVLVAAGGSLAKLGMKFLGALEHGVPILEDVLAGTAILVGPAPEPGTPVIRTDAVGTHRVASRSSQQSLLEDIVGRPLDAMGRSLTDIDVYATELHNPEITEPAGGGDVPDRNYRMLAGLGVLRGELGREEIEGFAHERGLPGFSPTQGHIASAIPWLPHALKGFASGDLRTTMLLAKGSLFLGRMTRSWDGASITLEV